MKVSLEWLSDYVKLPNDPEDLAYRLTMAGLNVDEIYEYGVDGQIVVGRIEKMRPHPNSEKLAVCDVNVGKKTLKVVTGDLKLEEGALVPVALPGTKLADGRIIEETVIKGVRSEGMMCSLQELGVEDQSDRIYVFEEDLEIGSDLTNSLKLKDLVFDIEITPNRGDCLSYLGVAREVATLYRTRVLRPESEFKRVGRRTEELVDIVIEDLEGCPRYTAMVVEGVEVGESPIWLKRRLMASGIRPINNVVDATNYVMLETGHPIHAFDYDLLKTRKIVVRKARKGERVVLLDEKEYHLLGGETLITDGGDTIIAVGGVMGAENSGINPNTKNVLVEVAYFDPVRIRKTKKGLGIDSDAAYRFERGVDPNDVEYVMKRVVSMIVELAGGTPSDGILDVYPNRISGPEVFLRKEKMESLLGIEIPEKEVEEILEGLDFRCERRGDGWKVFVPTHRMHDVSREVDLIEEIGRIYGYDRVKSERTLIWSGLGGLNDRQRMRRKIVELMKGFGFDEIVTMSFTSSDLVKRWKFKEEETLKLLNPITDDMDVMRESLVYTMMETLSYNYTHQRRNVKVFEIGKIYWRDGENLKERETLGAMACGLENERDYTDKRKVDFLAFKGVMDGLLERFGIFPEYIEAELVGFVPTRCAVLKVRGEEIGFVGMVDPDVVREYDVKDDVFYFELDLEKIWELKVDIPSYRPSPMFPGIRRDVSFLLRKGIRSHDVLKFMREFGGDIVEEVGVSDVYRGEGIPEGMVSVTFYVVFRSGERTLTDEEVNSLFEKMIEEIESRFDVKRRY